MEDAADLAYINDMEATAEYANQDAQVYGEG
jgi:hypothetical protein